MIPYTLTRSNRKTVAIQIAKDGTLLVRAPKRCPRSYIDQFVAAKEPWILTHQAQAQDALARRSQFQLREGDALSFFGRPLTVHLRQDHLSAMDLEMGTIRLPEASVAELRPLVGALYKKYGLPLLRRRLDAWAGRMGVSYEDLKMSSAVRRWGSCSYSGTIRISWYLLFAPERP